MNVLAGVLLTAFLFVLLGVLRPVRRCDGHCGACPRGCEREGTNDRGVS